MNKGMLLGQMLAFAKMGKWEDVDNILHKLSSEMWLETELETLEDVQDFIYAAGYEIYGDDNE